MTTASKPTPPFWVASSHVLQIKRPRTSAVKAVFWTSTLSGASMSRGRFVAMGFLGWGFGELNPDGFYLQPKKNRSSLYQFETLAPTPGKPVSGYQRRSKSSPAIDRATPSKRTGDAGSLKNSMPATAIIAAPTAKIAGTAESGPPF